MSEPSHRGNLWAWAAAGLVAVVVALGFGWSFDAPLPAPTQTPAASDAVVAGPASEEPASVSRVEAGLGSEDTQTGVYGQLLDCEGQPLVGFAVCLSPREARAPGANLLASGGSSVWVGQPSSPGVATGNGGEFAFPQVIAGDYQLETAPFAKVVRPVTVTANERLDVTFQLTDREVATTGQVLRSGQVQKSLRLTLQDGEHWQGNAKSDDGLYRIVLPAGEHTIGVNAPQFIIRYNVPCGRRRLLVPANKPRLQWTMALACTDLVVFARDERGMLPEGGQVTVRSLDEDPLAKGERTRPVAPKGTWFRFLPPGDYEVLVAGKRLATAPVQKLAAAAANIREERHFVVPRAATVKLLVKASGKVLQSLPAESMPVLRVGTTEYPYGRIKDHGARYSGRVDGFHNHPPGNAVIVSEDRVVDGEVRFLAFDPIPEQFVHALLDQPNELEITVRRRALVDLRACESSGREQISASIEVFAGDQLVRPITSKFCQRFRSYLPPGDYRIVIDRGGERREHKLKVARRDIRLRLRP